MTSRPSQPSVNPNAAILRHRATALRSFAGTIDQLLVTRIDVAEFSRSLGHADSRHWRLRRQLLDHNLHQLHRAAEDLRDVAHQMWQFADHLDHSRNVALTSGV